MVGGIYLVALSGGFGRVAAVNEGRQSMPCGSSKRHKIDRTDIVLPDAPAFDGPPDGSTSGMDCFDRR